MKYIALKTIDFRDIPDKPEGFAEDVWKKLHSIDYKATLKMALDNSPVSTYAHIKSIGKLIAKIKSAEGFLSVADEELELIKKMVDGLQFAKYDEAIEEFMHDMHEPLDEKPEDA